MQSRFVAGVMLAAATAGCAANTHESVPPTYERDPVTTITTVPETTTTTTLPNNITTLLGNVTVRVVEVADTNGCGKKIQGYDDCDFAKLNLEQIGKGTVTTLAKWASRGQTSLNFLPVSNVTLNYNAESLLCDAKTTESYQAAQDKIHEDAIDLAIKQGQRNKAEATVFTYDFSHCDDPSRSVIGPNGELISIGGEGDAEHKAVDLNEGEANIVAHELIGHVLGNIGHAGATDCGQTKPKVFIATDACKGAEYGDVTNVMGNSMSIDYDPLNGYQMARTDLLGSKEVTTVTQSGTYELSALTNQDSHSKLLQIPLTTRVLDQKVSPEFLYVELSGDDNVVYDQNVKHCRQGDGSDEPACLTDQGVSVKFYRGLETKTSEWYPDTLLYSLGSDHEYRYPEYTGAQADRVGQKVFAYEGPDGQKIEVTLKSLASTGKATGAASVQISITD